MTRVPVAAGKNIRNVAEGNELSALRADFLDRINWIYMIFIYPDYPVDPVKKKEIAIL